MFGSYCDVVKDAKAGTGASDRVVPRRAHQCVGVVALALHDRVNLIIVVEVQRGRRSNGWCIWPWEKHRLHHGATDAPGNLILHSFAAIDNTKRYSYQIMVMNYHVQQAHVARPTPVL